MSLLLETILDTKEAFAKTLKQVRNDRGLSQEDFGLVSSRTYISSLERGLYSPTLEKVDDLARVLDMHPMSLLIQAWALKDGLSTTELIELIKKQTLLK